MNLPVAVGEEADVGHRHVATVELVGDVGRDPGEQNGAGRMLGDDDQLQEVGHRPVVLCRRPAPP